jgi:hypothetical protein
MEGLVVERVGWHELRPHPDNPRATDTEVIKESVRVNGVYRPVIVARNGTILAGHHLWAALGELGHREVDVVRLDVEPDSPEAIRVMLVDNRSADVGGYDESSLLRLLESVSGEVGLQGTGYRGYDLDVLRAWAESDVTLVDVLEGPEWNDMLAEKDLTLTITGLTNSDIQKFRDLEGDNDAERLRGLL